MGGGVCGSEGRGWEVDRYIGRQGKRGRRYCVYIYFIFSLWAMSRGLSLHACVGGVVCR
jgi:hypothetical protein